MLFNKNESYTTRDGKVVSLEYEITYTDRFRYKFDSAIAEYLYQQRVLNGYDGDDYASDADCGESAHRFGRRILVIDRRGAVSVNRFDTEDEARTVFDRLRVEIEGKPEEEDEPGIDPTGYACRQCALFLVNGDGTAFRDGQYEHASDGAEHIGNVYVDMTTGGEAVNPQYHCDVCGWVYGSDDEYGNAVRFPFYPIEDVDDTPISDPYPS